ncbi:MAG: OmpA family protein [Granulosicoccus sp.]
MQTFDPELLTVIPSGKDGFDPAILQFDFVPDGDFVTIEYVFGSDEYPEFVYSEFSDGIGIFIDRDGVANSAFGNSEARRAAAVEAPLLGIRKVPKDSDGDGIVNSRDRCPKSQPRDQVNVDGCRVYAGVLQGVSFNSGSASLTPDAEQILQTLVRDLAIYPAAKVAVATHTDNSGDKKTYRSLSKKRTIAVLRFLLQQGILKSRLSGKAYGDARPIASNDTESGRVKNTRAEVNVTY